MLMIAIIIFLSISSIAATSIGIQQYRSNNEETENNKSFNFLVIYLIFSIFMLLVCFGMIFYWVSYGVPITIKPEDCIYQS
jgi:flagellar basal body-associated protein FliL